MSTKLIINGLFEGATKSVVRERFGHGDVYNIKVTSCTDTEGKVSSRASMMFRSLDQLKKCIAVYNKTTWKGSLLSLRQGKSKEKQRITSTKDSVIKVSTEKIKSSKNRVCSDKEISLEQKKEKVSLTSNNLFPKVRQDISERSTPLKNSRESISPSGGKCADSVIKDSSVEDSQSQSHPLTFKAKSSGDFEIVPAELRVNAASTSLTALDSDSDSDVQYGTETRKVNPTSVKNRTEVQLNRSKRSSNKSFPISGKSVQKSVKPPENIDHAAKQSPAKKPKVEAILKREHEDSCVEKSDKKRKKNSDVVSKNRTTIVRHKDDDVRRQAAIDNLQERYNVGRNIIQQALSRENVVCNKKTIFDTDEPDDSPTSGTEVKVTKSLDGAKTTSTFRKPVAPRLLLFDGENDASFNENGVDTSDDKRFNIKPQFSGKHGKKLLELQSRFSTDSRFAIDERFADHSDEDDTETDVVKLANSGLTSNIDEGIKEERKRALDILASLVGPKVSKDEKSKKSRVFPMLRYDPENEEHKRYEKPIVEKVPKKKPSPAKKHPREGLAPSSDTSRYFSVDASISNLFPSGDSTKKSAFRLADTFTSSSEDVTTSSHYALDTDYSPMGRDRALKEKREDKAKKPDDRLKDRQPTTKIEALKIVSSPLEAAGTASVVAKNRTFFYKTTDSEVQESLKFFCSRASKEEIEKDWLKNSSEMFEANRKRQRGYRMAVGKRARLPGRGNKRGR